MRDFSWLEGKLAPRSERVLEAAVSVSEKRGHRFLGVEHLVYGLLEAAPDAARSTADAAGVSVGALREEVDRLLGFRCRPDWEEDIHVTPRMTAILTMALDEAKRDGATQISPTHLWRAILREGQSAPARLLLKAGRCAETVITEMRRELRQSPEALVLPPPLQEWCYDLTALAESNKLAPVLGRDEEIRRLIQILLVPDGPANPILTGPAGVGKSALVEGLAEKLVSPGGMHVPERLRHCRIFALSMNAIVAGAMFRGSLEGRMQQVVSFFSEHRDRAILFIDEIHSLARFGVADALLEPLARGRLRLIGATTTGQFNQLLRDDEALNRRFTQVEVGEPNRETVLTILQSLQERYVEQCGVRIGDAAIMKALELCPRYVRSQRLPHKAKHWLELAIPLAELDGRTEVNAGDVMRVVAEQTGVPVDLIARAPQRLDRLSDVLNRRIIGQDHVINQLQAWAKGALGPLPRRNPTAPSGVFLFLGPTGVGKTETAKALTEFLFGDESRMIRLDMAEYQDSLAYQRLIGFGRGIVGAERGGLLTERVKQTPYTLILLDEIEKAHATTLQLFLSILDEGWVTSGLGETVYFSDTIIVMTSNLGGELFEVTPSGVIVGGYETDADAIERKRSRAPEELREAVIADITSKRLLTPEFLNRIHAVLVFDPLSRESAERIISLLADRLNERIGQDGKEVVVERDAVRIVLNEGFDPRYGARSLERAFREMVESTLAERYTEGRRFRVHADGAAHIVVTSDGEPA
jgi:ATP-dependent Clp protease ATP-binding subunit ClpC